MKRTALACALLALLPASRPSGSADRTIFFDDFSGPALDRAKFAKLRDYLLRLDDEVVCKTCGKKFEIPSQQSMIFLDQLAGLPDDEELEREIAEAAGEPAGEPAAPKKPELPARFRQNSSNWK